MPAASADDVTLRSAESAIFTEWQEADAAACVEACADFLSIPCTMPGSGDAALLAALADDDAAEADELADVWSSCVVFSHAWI